MQPRPVGNGPCALTSNDRFINELDELIGRGSRAGRIAVIDGQVFWAVGFLSKKHCRMSSVPAVDRACAESDAPEIGGVMPGSGSRRPG